MQKRQMIYIAGRAQANKVRADISNVRYMTFPFITERPHC